MKQDVFLVEKSFENKKKEFMRSPEAWMEYLETAGKHYPLLHRIVSSESPKGCDTRRLRKQALFVYPQRFREFVTKLLNVQKILDFFKTAP